jgi:hypothetical protein
MDVSYVLDFISKYLTLRFVDFVVCNHFSSTLKDKPCIAHLMHIEGQAMYCPLDTEVTIKSLE